MNDDLKLRARDLIIKNLKKYWPTRVADFENDLIDIDIIELDTKERREYLKELRQKSSITDKTNNLILGFEIGIFFVEPGQLESMINEERINREISELKKDGKLTTKDISDTYHTFGDLYDHRMAFNVALTKAINLVKKDGLYAYKSMKHHDGTMFEGMFIVVIESKFGQISYHYNLDRWNNFDLPVYDEALEYDGHTPADTIERLLKLF